MTPRSPALAPGSPTRASHDRREGRLIGGVTAGFARRFGINLLVARVAAIAGVVILTPLLYMPLWILMPKDAAQ